jgi:amino acid transporter
VSASCDISSVPRVGDKPPEEESPKERADRELIELLNELRIVLPGVTVLFGFLLAVPFAKGWPKVTPFERDVFLVAFLATGVSVVFLTAPSSYHRLRFRAGNKEHLVRQGSRLAVAGIGAFAVALEAVVLLVFDYVLSTGSAVVATVGFTLFVVFLWYGLPLYGRLREP